MKTTHQIAASLTKAQANALRMGAHGEVLAPSRPTLDVLVRLELVEAPANPYVRHAPLTLLGRKVLALLNPFAIGELHELALKANEAIDARRLAILTEAHKMNDEFDAQRAAVTAAAFPALPVPDWSALAGRQVDELSVSRGLRGVAQPRFPEGTPEYEAYAAELRGELAKWSTGQAPYEFTPVIEREIGGVPSVLSRLVDGVWRPLRVGEHVRDAGGESFAVEGVAPINGVLWVFGMYGSPTKFAARAPIAWPDLGTLAWRPAAVVEAEAGAVTMIETVIDGRPHALVVSAADGGATPLAAGDVITNADGEQFRVSGLFRSGRRSWADGEFVEAPGVAGAARIGAGSAFGLWWMEIKAPAVAAPADPSSRTAILPSDASLTSADVTEPRRLANLIAARGEGLAGIPAYELALSVLRGYVGAVSTKGLDQLRRGAGELS